ncbi:choice-of-anchor L domain-containing protein [Parvularcula maris]|uniref:VPLPA-CTERM sorting domain-containing protein n=1 Tax=Parvularcula maris TaxID=2965077 RepID=A0A9X2RJX7_9PROT|nr:choice-of-anchor L domain-containing protein [Parvularcula maris]MCQ8185193.1 VPLPA-CTERM sorting domain-containing protein [Parvularcula maris]
MRNLLATIASGAVLCFASAQAITVTQTDDATALVNAILGEGITLVGTPTLTGASIQFGTFTDGTDTVGFATGIVLSTGDVSDIGDGPSSTFLGGTLGGAGTDLIEDSNDAATLTFSFSFDDPSAGSDIAFNYVFASEEYPEFVDSEFIDAFRLIVGEEDLALVSGDVVNINNVNIEDNSEFFVPNGEVDDEIGEIDGPIAFVFDGFTVPLVAQTSDLGTGVFTATIVIADVGDEDFDSAVFIQGGTFDSGVDDPTGPVVPIPAGLPLMLGGLAALRAVRGRRG